MQSFLPFRIGDDSLLDPGVSVRTKMSSSFGTSDRQALLELCASLNDRGSDGLQTKINKYVSLTYL